MRVDDIKGEKRHGQERRQMTHTWGDTGDEDNKHRIQKTSDEHNDMTSGRMLVEGDITKYRVLVARISYLSQDRPCLKFGSMQVCCAMANPTTSDREKVKRIGRYLAGRPRAKCWLSWQQSGEVVAYSDADWGGDKATRRSVSGGVIMRSGHCLMVWAKRQQVMALSTAEIELWAAAKSASESLGIQRMAKDMGIKCWLNLHHDAASTLHLVNRLVLGKAKHVDMPNLRIQEVPKSGKFVTKNVRGQVNPADLMTKPPPRPQIEQLMKVM